VLSTLDLTTPLLFLLGFFFLFYSQDAIDTAFQAIAKYTVEKDIAAFVKKEFDRKHQPTWHVVVGRNFGSYVSHESKHFAYFYVGQLAFLLFRAG